MRHHLWLFVPYLLASLASLIIIYSISPDRFAYQAIWLALGFIILIYLSRQDPAIFSSSAQPAYFLTIILLLATFVFGESVRGSIRWIPLGNFRFQPSEIAKPLLIVFFADLMERYPPKNILNLARCLAFLSLPLYLVLRQPDLGTAIVITVIFLGQLLIAGLPTWLILLGLGFGSCLVYLSPQLLQPYQFRRLEAFLDPNLDPLGSGYNVIQSQIAIGSGGFLGKGLGAGTQSHLRFLPERHTDFIFASLIEELGFLGGLFVLGTLTLILYYLASRMLTRLPTSRRLILAGIFSYLIFQVFINVGMTLGLAPVTGVTLPLISYGGSSILATSLALGIAGAITGDQVRSQSSIEIK